MRVSLRHLKKRLARQRVRERRNVLERTRERYRRDMLLCRGPSISYKRHRNFKAQYAEIAKATVFLQSHDAQAVFTKYRNTLVELLGPMQSPEPRPEAPEENDPSAPS